MYREEVISELINIVIATVINYYIMGDNSHITDILRMGIKGYENFTNAELLLVYNDEFDFDNRIFEVLDDID